jgi:uncharacterized phage-associated protein
MDPKLTFDDAKAAHVAALFLALAESKEMKLLKLMKLMYLAERRSFELYQEPMIGDRLVSMKHGPVLSNVLDLMNGASEDEPKSPWRRLISDRSDNFLSLKKKHIAENPELYLTELSDADIDIVKEIWERYGDMDAFALRDFTHEALPEWANPGESSSTISIKKLLEVLGFDSEAISAASDRITAQTTLGFMVRK